MICHTSPPEFEFLSDSTFQENAVEYKDLQILESFMQSLVFSAHSAPGPQAIVVIATRLQ